MGRTEGLRVTESTEKRPGQRPSPPLQETAAETACCHPSGTPGVDFSELCASNSRLLLCSFWTKLHSPTLRNFPSKHAWVYSQIDLASLSSICPNSPIPLLLALLKASITVDYYLQSDVQFVQNLQANSFRSYIHESHRALR